jgi:hypothetical protein
MIQSKHAIKILGEPKFILGLKLSRCTNGNIIIDQNQYIKDVAARFEVVSNPSKLIRMPCTASQFKRIEDESKEESLIDLSIDIRSMVGSLMYASLGTRPDITYFVNYISRYLIKPTVYIKKIILQAINYLLDTPFIYIICFSDYKKIPQLVTFVDAGHASEQNRKGITAGLLKFGKTPVLWNSTKQSTYSLSTAETEYKALSETLKETLYLKSLFEELGLVQEYPLAVYEDNTATIAMSNNPIINKKSKHIELAFHHFKYHVQKGVIKLYYVASKNQEADLLTKVVASLDLFYSLIKKIFNVDTILVHPQIESVNRTLMINTKDPTSNKQSNVSERSMNLMKGYNHVTNNTYGYANSLRYDDNVMFEMRTREDAYEQWINNEPFEIQELKYLSTILEYHLKQYSIQYSILISRMTECDSNFKLRFPNGYHQLKQYHEFMEQNTYSIHIMRKMINIHKDIQVDDYKMFSKDLIEAIIIDHDINLDNLSLQDQQTHSFVGMIRAATDEIITDQQIQDAIDLWLANDQHYQDDIINLDDEKYANIKPTDKEYLVEASKKRSIKRRAESIQVDLDEVNTFLLNDAALQRKIRHITNDERNSVTEREHKINILRQEAIVARVKLPPNININPEYYRMIFPATEHEPSESVLALTEVINKTRIVKTTPPKVELHRLKRNSDEINNNRHNSTDNTNNDQILPLETKHHHRHHRMTNKDRDEFIHLAHQYFPSEYNQIVSMLAMANNAFSQQAKSDYHNRSYMNNYDQDREWNEDDENNDDNSNDENISELFQSEEAIQKELDEEEERDNNNNKKRKNKASKNDKDKYNNSSNNISSSSTNKSSNTKKTVKSKGVVPDKIDDDNEKENT